MGSILSIDYGLKRIGLAVSDPMRSFTFPFGVIENKNIKQILSEIKQIVTDRDIDLILIGLPLNMDNSKSEMTLKVELFANQVEKELNLKVVLLDERLSSFQAEENLRKSNLNAKKMKKYVDSEAARIILEDYINSSSKM